MVARVRPIGSFRYRAVDPDSGLVEHELDHVFVAHHEGPVDPDPSEVDAVEWVDLDDLRDRLAREPERFTPWLPMALDVLDAAGPSQVDP